MLYIRCYNLFENVPITQYIEIYFVKSETAINDRELHHCHRSMTTVHDALCRQGDDDSDWHQAIDVLMRDDVPGPEQEQRISLQ